MQLSNVRSAKDLSEAKIINGQNAINKQVNMVRASANYPNSNNLQQLNSDSRLGGYDYKNNNSSAS